MAFLILIMCWFSYGSGQYLFKYIFLQCKPSWLDYFPEVWPEIPRVSAYSEFPGETVTLVKHRPMDMRTSFFPLEKKLRWAALRMHTETLHSTQPALS